MWVIRVLVLATCYYGAGRLGLLLAGPPGFASAFWPASGIALAGLLRFGYRVWPGIVLGSFLLNIPTTFRSETVAAVTVSLALPLGIGAGAALQALIGAVLVRRFVGFPNMLNREQAVGRFLLLGGPISCLTNATVSVTLLWSLHRIQARECLFNWWVWWIGDSIGALVVAPLVILWLTRPQPDWPRRAITVTVPLGVFTALIVAIFVYTDVREQERLRQEFGFETRTLTRALQNHMEYALMVLHTSRGDHGNVPNSADRQKYKKTALNILSHRAPVQALSWTPRILASERARFEDDARRTIDPWYTIREQNETGDLVPAPARLEYFPILYREPPPERVQGFAGPTHLPAYLVGHLLGAQALAPGAAPMASLTQVLIATSVAESYASAPQGFGFDVASEADRLDAQHQAADTGAPIACAPVSGSPRGDGNKNILVFLPIYRDGIIPESVTERQAALVGYMVAVLRTGQMVDLAWEGFRNEGIDFWLTDDTNPDHPRPTYSRCSRRNSAADSSDPEPIPTVSPSLQQTTGFEFAGRRWTLHFVQTAEYVAANRSLQAWTVLSGGMLFTGLLGAILLVVTGREALIAGIVEERTAALDESRRFAERIAAMLPKILYVYDLKAGANVFANGRIQTILGYSDADAKRPIPEILRDHVHPDDWTKVDWGHEQLLHAADGDVIESEFRIKHANGTWCWLHHRSTIFTRDTDGSPCQILGTAQDITERKRLEQEVLDVAAQEQRRIGQELHDGTGQALTGLSMLADNLADVLRSTLPAEAPRADRVAQGLRLALAETRALSRGLIPVEVDAEGLMAALAELAKRITEMHAIRCTFGCVDPVLVEDNFVATQLFRIAQEAITNSLKHGKAGSIRVSLEAKAGFLTLRIADDGVGFVGCNGENQGMGLRIMKYRAGQIGAQFAVRPGPHHGTVVTCTCTYHQGVSDD